MVFVICMVCELVSFIASIHNARIVMGQMKSMLEGSYALRGLTSFSL